MPLYFFHVTNGDSRSPDDEGSYFDDYAAAEREAILSVRDLLVESLKHGDPISGWKVDIADEDGKVLSTVPAQQLIH